VLKVLHSLATDPILHTSFGDILCEFGLISSEVLHLAKPLQVHLKELKYTNCKLGSTACVVTTTKLGLPHLLKTGVNLGEVLDTKNAEGFFTQVKTVCGEILSCEYKGESLVAHAIGTQAGGVAGSLKYSGNAVKSAGGFLCPSKAELLATYVDLHAPELFISE
jgi:hypothetical protein